MLMEKKGEFGHNVILTFTNLIACYLDLCQTAPSVLFLSKARHLGLVVSKLHSFTTSF